LEVKAKACAGTGVGPKVLGDGPDMCPRMADRSVKMIGRKMWQAWHYPELWPALGE